MALDPAALVLRIDESFGGSPYPGDEHIVRDNSGSDPESTRIKDELRGRHWRDVSFEALERLRFALPFLSAEGYRFYLPAFMTMSIVDFPRAGVISDEVVRSLTPPLPSDVDRMRDLANAHPEMQPFDENEWEELLETMRETYRGGGPAESMFFERVSGFDTSQSKTIREFLQYMQGVHGDEFPGGEPERALERYWSSIPGSSTN
jgi:hypothetical protein